MNILILGCSFGVPDNGCPAQFHTENQLKILGHTVYNCAKQGASNLESLAIAREFCKNTNCRIDWIVWFHTELVRDYFYLHSELQGTGTFYLQDIIKIVYGRYSQFINELQAKIAVIGGAGPVHPLLYNFIEPDYCISSWFSKILDLDLPQVQTLSRLDYIELLQSIGINKKIQILQQHKEILDALERSDDFPDNYHPGIKPHIDLANELDKVFLQS